MMLTCKNCLHTTEVERTDRARCARCDADLGNPDNAWNSVTQPDYTLIGEAEPLDDDGVSVQPRAGDVCRIQNEDELWMPYGGIGNDVEAGRFRFARYPNVDRVQEFDVSDVAGIAIPAESSFARSAWELVESKLRSRESGTFARRLFVFRAHEGACATRIYQMPGAGMLIYSGLHPNMANAREGVELRIAREADVEVTWCIGRPALQEHIDSGALRDPASLLVEFGDDPS